MRNSFCILLLLLCHCLMAQTNIDIDGNGRENANDVRALADIVLGIRDPYAGQQYVDLGLASGTLWATTNLGASSREDFGLYLAWGETEEKAYYSWDTYLWGSSPTSLFKYCTKEANGRVDGESSLSPVDDAARYWLMAQWQLPSLAQIMELVNSCTWVWSSVNGVKGYYVFGSNGRSIFLPATGYVDGDDLCNVGTNAVYWTRELFYNDDSNAYGLLMEKGYRSWAIRERCLAMPVRAVTSPSSVFCDLNGDGKVSIADVATLIQSVSRSN